MLSWYWVPAPLPSPPLMVGTLPAGQSRPHSPLRQPNMRRPRGHSRELPEPESHSGQVCFQSMCWSHPTCYHPSDIPWCAAMHGLQQPGLGKGTLPLLEDGGRCFLFTGTVSLRRKWDWLRAPSTALLAASYVTSGRPLTLSPLCGHVRIRRFPVLTVVRAQGARRSAGEPLWWLQ